MIAYVHRIIDDEDYEPPEWTMTTTGGTGWLYASNTTWTGVPYYEETDEETKARLRQEHREECQQAFWNPPRRLFKQSTRTRAYRDYRKHGGR